MKNPPASPITNASQHLPERRRASGEERDHRAADHRPLEDRSLVLHVALAHHDERRDRDAQAHQREGDRCVAGVLAEFALHVRLDGHHDRGIDRQAGRQQEPEQGLQVGVVEHVANGGSRLVEHRTALSDLLVRWDLEAQEEQHADEHQDRLEPEGALESELVAGHLGEHGPEDHRQGDGDRIQCDGAEQLLLRHDRRDQG
jgi:hypothetical protein